MRRSGTQTEAVQTGATTDQGSNATQDAYLWVGLALTGTLSAGRLPWSHAHRHGD